MLDLYASTTVAKCSTQSSNWKYLFGEEHQLSPVNESPIKIAAPLAAPMHTVVAKPRVVEKAKKK